MEVNIVLNLAPLRQADVRGDYGPTPTIGDQVAIGKPGAALVGCLAWHRVYLARADCPGGITWMPIAMAQTEADFGAAQFGVERSVGWADPIETKPQILVGRDRLINIVDPDDGHVHQGVLGGCHGRMLAPGISQEGFASDRPRIEAGLPGEHTGGHRAQEQNELKRRLLH